MSQYSPYQRGIIKRFYEHRETIAVNKLAEALSNLYLEKNKSKITRTWNSVKSQLLAAGIPKDHAEELCSNRDLDTLAKIVQELS